jgi:hypothetical protein
MLKVKARWAADIAADTPIFAKEKHGITQNAQKYLQKVFSVSPW